MALTCILEKQSKQNYKNLVQQMEHRNIAQRVIVGSFKLFAASGSNINMSEERHVPKSRIVKFIQITFYRRKIGNTYS